MSGGRPGGRRGHEPPSLRPSAWDEMMAADAHEQVTALTDRLPTAACSVWALPEQQGRADQFRFGREPDGTPAAPWGWEDLYLWLAPLSRRSRRNRHSTDYVIRQRHGTRLRGFSP
jgi:hypothetical protein